MTSGPDHSPPAGRSITSTTVSLPVFRGQIATASPPALTAISGNVIDVVGPAMSVGASQVGVASALAVSANQAHAVARPSFPSTATPYHPIRGW